MVKLRQLVMRMLRSSNVNNLAIPSTASAFLIRESMPLLLGTMVTSHLAALNIKPPGSDALALATTFDPSIKRLKRTLGMSQADVDLLTNTYQTTVFNELKKQADQLGSMLNSAYVRSVEEGATVQEAIKTVDDRMQTWGVDPENMGRVETLYRSMSAMAYSAGEWSTYQDEDVQETLWGFQYVAFDIPESSGGTTRDNHAAADGVTLPKDHEFWQTMWPPNGYNCRCRVVPLYEPHDEVEPDEDAEPDPGWGFNPGFAMEMVLSHQAQTPILIT